MKAPGATMNTTAREATEIIREVIGEVIVREAITTGVGTAGVIGTAPGTESFATGNDSHYGQGRIRACLCKRGAAGADLRACIGETVVLKPGERLPVPTGVHIELPDGYEAQIRPRSGLALRSGITLINSPGTVDSDYRGEIICPLINLGNEPFQIEPGMRIAQMVIGHVSQAEFELVQNLAPSSRGSNGFGSTGVH